MEKDIPQRIVPKLTYTLCPEVEVLYPYNAKRAPVGTHVVLRSNHGGRLSAYPGQGRIDAVIVEDLPGLTCVVYRIWPHWRDKYGVVHAGQPTEWDAYLLGCRLY